MEQHDTTGQNGESAKGMQKSRPFDSECKSAKDASKGGANRFSSVYWEGRVYRPVYRDANGQQVEVAHYWVQIAHAGRRHAVPLGANNVEEAGRRALKLFKTLKQQGWDAALRLFRPDAAEPIKDKALTVGRYLELVDEYAPLSPITLTNYSYAIRRIAADIAQVKLGKGVNRFDPSGPWRELADAVPLQTITPLAVEDWRSRFLKAHRGNPVEEQRASRTVNYYVRNSRALFSRRILEAMRKHDVTLPDPLPFAGVRLEQKTGSTRYRSQIDAGTLLNTARTELAESDPDAYAVILLALGAGLRRAEIDGLQFQHVMPEKGIIRVMTTAQRRVKSDESEGDVMVDGGLFTELERTRRPGKTLYVIQPDTEHPKSKAAQVYRADDTFKRVTAWLRKQGVMSIKPLHTLRKEFGSVVAAAGDIHQAQRQLRHAQISTTEQYYADARNRATVPIGSLLTRQTAAEDQKQASVAEE